MYLPIHLVKFWYPEALVIFIRVWHNLVNILEEDLAVGLMTRLLFTPLFHDSSFVGRILSFFFRLSRIIFGLFAFFFATLFALITAAFWFISPFILLLYLYNYFFHINPLPNPFGQYLSFIFNLSVPLLIYGIALFIHHIYHRPYKKVWQINSLDKFWDATKLTPKDITWENLQKSLDVRSYLDLLELKGDEFPVPTISLSPEYLTKVFTLAQNTRARYITPAFFWLAAIKDTPNLEAKLMTFNLKPSDLDGALEMLEHRKANWRKVHIWDDDFAVKHLKGVNRGWLGAPTPALNSVSEDLTVRASTIGFPDFIGREGIVQEVVKILSQGNDRNVLLVGPPGSGRTALVNYLASMIIAGDAPDALATKRLVSLDFPRLMSHARSEADLAEVIKNVFEEVRNIEGIIIFIDEFHNLGSGDMGNSLNLYSLMLPFLESGDFQFIASTDEGNYEKIIEKNSGLVRIFHKIVLPPASDEDTRQILMQKSIEIAKNSQIVVTYLAISELIQKSKLIHETVLPDSALNVLEECLVDSNQGLVTSEIVKQVLSRRINVPVVSLNEVEKELLLNLENIIHQRLIDQEPAVKKVADTLRRSAAELREQNRPIGSFLFVGPTGVGKTELAKTLSEVYFKQKGAFVRFDMSEYQNPEAISRLIGDSQNRGELTEAIRNNPYSLLLLDEFEKADPKILTLFLQVLDDGRLTDSQGITIDFTNTIIIATSNVASLIIAQELQKGTPFETVEKLVREELLKIYRPELINRFDAVVIFKPLSQADLEKIVQFKLNDISGLLKEEGYLIEFSPEILPILAQQGFDPVLGARPLRRLLQDNLEAKLSKMILQGELKKGEVYNIGIELLNL